MIGVFVAFKRVVYGRMIYMSVPTIVIVTIYQVKVTICIVVVWTIKMTSLPGQDDYAFL